MDKVVFMVVLALGATAAQAQISVGIKAGYTKAWEDYGSVPLPEDAQIHVNRFNVSALGYYSLSKRLQLGIEPGYVQRGAACVPGFIIFERDTKLMLNYLELPILAKGSLPLLNGKMEIFAKVGIGGTVAIKAYQEITTLGTDNPPVRSPLDLSDRNVVNRWDYGVHSGLGLAFKLGDGKLFFESDYYHGFMHTVPLNASQNRSIDLGIGYMLTL